MLNIGKWVPWILVTGCTTLVLCEAALRIAWRNPYQDETPDQVLRLAIHHPLASHILDRSAIENGAAPVRFRTDERGYLLPSRQHEHPDATIAFLGGSTTECKFVAEDLRFPALVARLFADHDLQINTLNAGRSGNTTHDALNVLINHLAQDSPDIAVLMEATNDYGVLEQAGGYASRSGQPVSVRELAKWSIQMASGRSSLAGLLRQRLTDMAGAFAPRLPAGRTAVEATDVATPQFRRRLIAFVRAARAFDIQPVLMTQPFSGSTTELTPSWTAAHTQDRFNAIIREVAAVERVPLIDLVQQLDAQLSNWREPDVAFYDGVHVNDRGSAAYAQVILQGLLPLVEELRARRRAGSASSTPASG